MNELKNYNLIILKEKTTKSLQGIRLNIEFYNEFEKKCEAMEVTKEKAIELFRIMKNEPYHK